MIKCHLVCRSASEYLTQLFTGFGILHKKKVIHLSYEKARNYVPGVNKHPRLRMILNDSINVVYDMRDISLWYEDDLEWSDYYFKRSYDPELVINSEHENKIFPYGFNYPVYGSSDAAYLRVFWSIVSLPSFHSKSDLRQIVEQTLRSNKVLSRVTNRENGRDNCAFENYEDIPHFEKKPIINMFTRLWDPAQTPDEYKEDSQAINNMRIECVKKLRYEFGDLFVGGIVPTTYALNCAKELVVDKKMTIKLKTLEKSRTTIYTPRMYG